MTKENGWHGKWMWKLAQKFGLNASLGWILWGWRGGGWLRDQVSPSVTQDSFCHKSYCTLLHCSTVPPPPASTIGNYRMGPPVWWKRRLCHFCPFHRFTVNRYALITQFQDYHFGPRYCCCYLFTVLRLQFCRDANMEHISVLIFPRPC